MAKTDDRTDHEGWREYVLTLLVQATAAERLVLDLSHPDSMQEAVELQRWLVDALNSEGKTPSNAAMAVLCACGFRAALADLLTGSGNADADLVLAHHFASLVTNRAEPDASRMN